MSKTVRYAMLGCGMMGLEHIKNLELIAGAEVVAIAEPDDQMKAEAKKLAPDAAFYNDLPSLIKHPDLNAIVIVTPNYQHCDQLTYVLENSELAILVEKPVVTSLDQVEKIKVLADQHKAPIWVAMEYRYMPAITDFTQRVADGDLGRVKTLTVCEHRFPFLEKIGDWNRFNEKTGGTLVEKCCHFFDLMRLISQSEVVRVYASTGQDVNHLDESYQGETPDIIDNGYVILDFANGLRAMLELNMFAEGSRYQEQISAIGPDGKLECFVPGPGRFWPEETLGAAPIAKIVHSPRAPKGPVETEVDVDPELLQAGDHNGSTFYQHVGFYNALTKGDKVDVTVDDGLKAVVIGLAAQHSAKTGQSVSITHNGLSYH